MPRYVKYVDDSPTVGVVDEEEFLDPIIETIGDVKISVRVKTEASRKIQLICRVAVDSAASSNASIAIWSRADDTMVGMIGEEEISIGIESESTRAVQIDGLAAKDSRGISFAISEELNPVVSTIGHVKMEIDRHNRSVRRSKERRS